MSECKICTTDYYVQSDLEPAEKCLCGESCPLSWPVWETYGWRGIAAMTIYRTAIFFGDIIAANLFNVADKVLRVKQ